MDVIRVHAPNQLHALRLIGMMDGSFDATLDGDGSEPVVALRLDNDTSAKLVVLFDWLGDWLTAGKLASCQVAFGKRGYTLLAATAGEPNDPTGFLLERTIQLQTALESRIVIEQAKGILAERHGLSPETAFERLRYDARSRRVKLHDLAEEVIASVPVAS